MLAGSFLRHLPRRILKKEGVMNWEEEEYRKRRNKAMQKAIETFDHLLWEMIARQCWGAISKTFQQQGTSVRVVYKTGSDPREKIREIIERIVYYVTKEPLDIREGFVPWTELNDCYQVFVLTEDFADQEGMVKVVRFGDLFVAPCNNDHLASTADLTGCKISMQQPKRVGKEVYEFRFSIEFTGNIVDHGIQYSDGSFFSFLFIP